jgi:hypothetical protein
MRKLTILCIVLLLGISLAGATTLVKMNFGDLARDADAVVVGTVTAIEGEWGPNLNFIHSNITLQVERTLRGQTDDTITLRNPGGIVGGEGQLAHGVAEFEIGEKVLIFLTRWEDNSLKVLGYAQGKSRVVLENEGSERLVGGSAHGHSVAGAAREIKFGTNHNIALRPVE